ncbi:MAG: helix-turn-helix domain-containing protein [Clostridiales Family XIII bacterium]|jgi:transcriptional regulator with XRE-family HTH domain|nr:helix-turn-helix domain-containing protein [Clostridiales Family XIII bacterium]
MKEYLEIDFGQAVRQARIKKGLTLEDVAARANLSPTSVRALELGRGSTVSTLIKVLRVIDELSLVEDWIARGEAFSPIAVLREKNKLAYRPKRVSSKRPRKDEGK